MIDWLLELGSIFDWISPLWSFLTPGTVTLSLPADDAWAAEELGRYIRIHAPQIVAGVVLFDIDEADLDAALEVLTELGFDIR